jgi:glycosyltransferase involved in cell wall biosynthesis
MRPLFPPPDDPSRIAPQDVVRTVSIGSSAGPWSILFTIPNFITAGSGRAMLNIIERLDRTRFAPAVCVSRKGGDLDGTVEKLGIPFMEAPFTIPPRPYSTLLWRAWRASRAFVPSPRSSVLRPPSSVLRPPSTVHRPPSSVLHPPWPRFALWHSFHYSDDYTEPMIARLAGARAWVYTKKNMGWGSRAWCLRTRFATRVAVQNSDMMHSFFANGSFRPKARPVPRGVDIGRFVPDARPLLGLRSSYGIPADALVVACVAQLVPVKGHPTLLDSLASIPGAHLFIAGCPQDQDYTSTLHERVTKLALDDRIHFLGGVKEVPALLAESDIFVLPTWGRWRMEGCPVALLEAMSCGKACVATDIPGSRDLVENGKSGLLVPPENADALAAALRQLASSAELRSQLGRAARQRVLDHFRIENEVAAHEALYNEILRFN